MHDVRVIALGQIVQSTNHGPVHKLANVVRGRIKVMVKQELGTHGNGLCSGTGINIDVFNNMLRKRGLRELMRSVLLLLDIYSYIVGRMSLVL